MSLFGFEASFLDAVNDIKNYGYKKHYADIYSDVVECIIDENNVVYDTNSNVMEDQNRYLRMVEMGALKEVKSLEVNEGVSFKDFKRGSKLFESVEAYEVSIGSDLGTYKAYTTTLGEIISIKSPDGSITEGYKVNNFFGTHGDSLDINESFNELEKVLGLGYNIKDIRKI